HELQRQARFGGRWALLLIDLDHFKRINDRHGHPAGDAVLRAVAALLTARLREVDIVARLGGEEFALLLPRTDAAGARTVAEALRRAIAGLSLPWGGAQLSLTASAGLVLSDEAPGLTADAAYALADRRLYAAKQAGRNRVVADDAEAQPRPSLRQISSVNAD
ncbi:MAG: GGDEF domain-containing protein, partial [Burkholderiales bacterium]|nr:GGDEF domain-containing protein [Burkholderiales bacterium]